MVHRRVAALLGVLAALVLLVGCKTVQTTGATTTVSGPWNIHETGIGALIVGAPIPAGLLDDAEQLYFARYIADGQPFEGFEFNEPPVTVGIRGPWTSFGATRGLMEPPVERFRQPATKKARAGLPVRVLLVHDAAVTTAAGVGVGSTLAELEEAHGTTKLRSMPPTLGDDGCSVGVEGMPGVAFVFRSCDAAREGEPVVRVDVWSPES